MQIFLYLCCRIAIVSFVFISFMINIICLYTDYVGIKRKSECATTSFRGYITLTDKLNEVYAAVVTQVLMLLLVILGVINL